jgi:cell division protease FtsH
MAGKTTRWMTVFWLIALLVGLFLSDGWKAGGASVELDYSEFLEQLKADNIRDLNVGTTLLRGELRQPLSGGQTRFSTHRVDPALAGQLNDASGLRYRAISESGWFQQMLGWVGPTLLLFLLWMLLLRGAGFGGAGAPGKSLIGVGRSRARVYVETDIKVSFSDVAGVDEAKGELSEVVGFLRDPTRHGRLGARIPRGILLVGPPGTGKTLLARAVAGEAGVPFFSINGSEFVELFVGVGAARVRDLFEQARRKAPAIIFIDEIDALGRARGAYGLGGHDEKEQTLNQLLAELDGFDPSSGVVLLAATNRPEILDPALLRAGRFDRQVLVDRPDRVGRVQILQVHIRRIRMDPKVVLDDLAALTPGFSGADLANLVNEAALLATRRDHAEVGMDDFTGALERIVAGLEKRNRLLNPAERKTVAFHEMGHALVALEVLQGETIHKVSIIPRGVGSLGYTIARPIEDRFLMTRDELLAKMAVLMGGRAAETLCLGGISTGASDDLVKVTSIARSMVIQYGMHPGLGPQAFDLPAKADPSLPWAMEPRATLSDATLREIDCAVRSLIDEALNRSLAILSGQRIRLEEGAARLLARETLGREELQALIEEFPPHVEVVAA